MSNEAVDLLIHSRPLWHQVDPQAVPVTVKTIFSVMGRRNNRWQNILSSTNDLHTARRTMDAANAAAVFDRIVITEGRSVNNAPAGNWQTIECALPQHRVVTGDKFNTLLHDMQNKTANANPEYDPQVQSSLIGKKEPHTVSLIVACGLAAWHSSPVLLMMVAVLAMGECFFLADKRPVTLKKMRKIQSARNWFYALVNGAMLLPLVFG